MPRVRTLALAVCVGAAIAGLAGGAALSNSGKSTVKPIRIMVLTAGVGSAVNPVPDLWDIADGYAKYLNETAKGIKGAPLQIDKCDEHADPNRAEQCAREAVSNGDVAVVGGISLQGARIFPILEAAGIPWVAPTPQDTSFYQSPMSFPVQGGGPMVVLGAAHLAGTYKKCPKVGVLGLGIPQIEFVVSDFIRPGLLSVGKDVATVTKIPVGSTDLQPYHAQVSQQADCIVTYFPEAIMLQLMPAMKQVNSKLKVFASISALTPKVISQNPGFGDGFIGTGVFPALSSPLWNTYKTVVQKYAPNAADIPLGNISEQNQWVSMVVFTRLANSVNGTVTAAKLIKVLNTTKNMKTGGLTPRIDFTTPFTGVPGYPRLFSRSVAYQVLKNGSMQQLSPGFQDMTNAWKLGLSKK